MDVEANADLAVSKIAAAIGEPARSRMLYSLLDGHARTGTELAAVAEVTPSTASVHLSRLLKERLVEVAVQGKHRYYSLHGNHVANALEALSVLAGSSRGKFVPNTPIYLRTARTCYDHIAGTLGVAMHDGLKALGWFRTESNSNDNAYALTESGTRGLTALGLNVDEILGLRRRFAFGCLDWSERRSHLGGALGAALLNIALKKRWITPEPGSRALSITSHGRREFAARFGVKI